MRTHIGRHEIGMFAMDEIIEISGGDMYARCFFRDCQFTGTGPAMFHDCTFEVSGDVVAAMTMPCNNMAFTECVFRGDPPSYEYARHTGGGKA